MTAEIALLNRSAVALAADSAVTIGGGGERSPKIFNTVNKLFTLSKHQPVGIMVYGSAQILSVPWETIIKVYRKRLGCRTLAHLEDYASDFLRFLNGNRLLFPASDQQNYFKGLVRAFYQRVNDDINKKIKEALNCSPKNASDIIRRLFIQKLKSTLLISKKRKTCQVFQNNLQSRLRRKFKAQLQKIQADVFSKITFEFVRPIKTKYFIRVAFRARQFQVKCSFWSRNCRLWRKRPLPSIERVCSRRGHRKQIAFSSAARCAN